MTHILNIRRCFETAFMHENPITRIVPQKVNDIIHFRNGYSTVNNNIRPPSRAQSCQAPLPSIGSIVSSTGWDSRSIATQTSDEESHENRGPPAVSTNVERRLRQPKWRRMARQRKSIAVMQETRETMELTNRFRSNSYSSSALMSTSTKQPAATANKPFRTCGSVDDLIAGDENQKQFLAKYEKLGQDEFDVQPRRQRRFSMVSLPATSSSSVGVVDLDPKMTNSSPPDNMILSKTVRKEKRKQRDRRERSVERNFYPQQQHQHESSPQSMVSSSVSSLASTSTACNHYRTLGQYRHLTVKTPIHICGHNAPIPSMDEGMQSARAIPFKEADYAHPGSGISLNPRGKQCAIESFQLLGLLLPPEHRRRLQLLLKFMKRVSSKHGLKISTHPTKNCYDVVLETFSESILKPKRDFANYDEDLCRKIVGFFMENYDEIWTPPVCLRKEVEDKVRAGFEKSDQVI